MTKWIFVAALLSSALPSTALGQSKDTLVGTWKLISSEDRNEKGEVRDSYRRNPTGFLTYTGDGRMIVISTKDGRKQLSVPDWIWSPADARSEAIATSVAYAGSYTFSNNKAIHHVETASVQNLVNSDFVRFIEKVDRDRLILRTSPLLTGGARVTQGLVWEQMRPNP